MLNEKKIFRMGLLSLFSCLFCLGNISDATVYSGSIPGEITQDQFAGYYYTYKIDKDLNFITIYDDIEYPFLFYTYNGEGCSNGLRALQFFWNNGQIYAFGNYRDNTVFGQGYLKYMCKSDTSNFQQYCLQENSNSNYTTDINELYETTINFNELYVDNLITGNQNPSCYGGTLGVCFISESTNTVYCIRKSIARGFTDDLTQGNLISTYGVLPSNYQNAINNNVYGESPLNLESGGGGEITGTNVVCPSVQFKIAMYGYKYNTGLCYTDPLEFTGGQIVQVQQQSIFEIFSGYQDYLNWKYIYENNCHAPYTNEHCINAMQTNRKARQIFSKIENAGLDSEKVYQYCHLQLEIEDKTQGVCNMTDEELYATGVNQQGSQPNPFESLTDFIEENINLGVEAPKEGTVFDEFLEDGETWITAITINRFGEFRKLYQKVMGLFAYRETQVGIIPGYITGIIMMILLLALFKK